MTKRRSIQAKRCKICWKILGIQNKSGLCSHHYQRQLQNKIKRKRKEQHLCLTCGVKVEQKLKFSFKSKKQIRFYPLRCPRCDERNKRFLKKYNQKPEVIARRKEYYQKNKEKFKEYFKEYNQRPEIKARIKAYNQRPEVKKRRREQRRKARLAKNN